MFMDPHGPTIAPRCPTTVIADKIKHIYFQKESKYLFLPTISVMPLCSQSALPFQNLATRAEAWHAIPGVSTWAMNTVKRDYTLQFDQFGFDIAQDSPSQPLRLLGAQGQFCQEHTATQPTSFVPGHSYRLSADDSNCLSGASHEDSAPHGFLQGRYRLSAQSFPENAGPDGSGFAGTSVGSASHATHPVLVEAESTTRGLVSLTPPPNGVSPYQPWSIRGTPCG